jgi:C4-dicarboxylate-specific signal transduction histidine kinase
VSAIAEQLGTIIEREWAEIELRRHRENLEKLLNTRTAELAKSKQRLNAEIHRRQTAEKALLATEAEE